MKIAATILAALLITLPANSQSPVPQTGAATGGSTAAVPPATTPATPAAEPTVIADGTSTEGALNSTITVNVRDLDTYLKQKKLVDPRFVLYLGGTAFTNLAVSAPTPGHNELKFYLQRVDANRDLWNALLRNPEKPALPLTLTVGIDKDIVFKSEMDKFSLRIYSEPMLYIAGVLFVVLLVLFLWTAQKSDVLRESGPPPPPPAPGRPVPRRAFSLARVQMAVWFFVVIASFSLIWIITSGLDTISPSVLALIGISTGTGLAAIVVDSGKSNSGQATKDQLLSEDSGLAATLAALASKPQPLSPEDVQIQGVARNRRAAIVGEIATVNDQLATPAHESFIIDILSDANGISFHRFQMAVWTLILAIIFLVSVKRDLVMPDFNTTLLGLMGISSGTYLGFKFPEVKN